MPKAHPKAAPSRPRKTRKLAGTGLGEKHYRAVLENQSEMVCRFRTDGTILFANNAYARARGTTSERLIGANFWNFIEENDHAAVRAMLERLTPQAPLVRIENQFTTAEGSRWTLWTNRALRFDDDGRLLEAQSTGIDITERKQAEEALARNARQMAALYTLADRLQRTSSLGEVYDMGMDAIVKALGCERASILLFDHAGVMRFVAWRGLSETYRKAVDGHSPWNPGEKNPRPFGVGDIGSADLDQPLKSVIAAEGIAALAFVPLLVESRLIGKLMVYYDAPHAFSEAEYDIALTIGHQVAYSVERQRAQSALVESQRRLRLIADSVPALIGYVDRDHRYGSVNACYGEWFGVGRSELTGMHMRDIVGEEVYTGRLPYIERVLAGETVRFEGQTPHHRLGMRDTELAYVPHFNGNGEVEGFYVMGFDITARKQTEVALRVRMRQQQAVARLGELALRERELQRVFDRSTVMVAQTLEVEYCKILEALPGGEELLLRAGVGWKNALVGETRVGSGLDSQAGYTLLSDGPVVVADLRTEQRFNGPRLLTEHGVISGMSCIIRGPGGTPWGAFGAHAARRIDFTQDDVNFLVAVANILSEAILHHRAEEALRDTDRRKDEFLAVLSHELRNPLAPLRNAVHVLRLTAGGNPATDRIHDMVERQVNHLVRLVDDLLETSRISRGTFDLRKERVDLATIVRNALETSEPLIRQAEHRLEVRMPQQPLWLDGDPVRLAQILSNLLNNAARYTAPGGEISLYGREQNGVAVISVRDNGMGIEPQALSRVFEMFSRGDRPGGTSDSGLGIGLALARRLAEMHGGTVEAQSDGPGEGSEFIVRLPLAAGQHTPGASPECVEAILPHKRILVVDDNRDAADSLGLLLQFLGADVRVARDGHEALDAFADYDPAVVLLDIGMPGMDGYEVARRIRSSFPDRRTPLVALTGWGQEDDRRRAREAGFDHHLVKPADVSALQALLTSLAVN